MFSEITVTLKDEDKKLIKKFPVYNDYTISEDDKMIRNCIEESVKEFVTKPDHISVKVTFEKS